VRIDHSLYRGEDLKRTHHLFETIGLSIVGSQEHIERGVKRIINIERRVFTESLDIFLQGLLG
jgi:alanine-alpha-ketoisovalerate/valine-pyruvate aminotransferase